MKAWMKNIRAVEPYVPGEQPQAPNMIKLNTNENPYPPAPGVERALKNMDVESLRLYPDPASTELAGALAENYALKENQVFVGVGSDDVLAIAFMTFFNSKLPILFPDITYSFYDVWAELFHIPYERPELEADFHINPKDYYKENGGVVIANPNAPTSLYEDLFFVEDILLHNQDVIVIVDEAYIDFGGESAGKLIAKYDNLLVVQTFSKSRSLAGMRIGYAMGNPLLIQAMNDVKYSFNSYTMNQTALIAGKKAVEDTFYFEEGIKKIKITREYTKERLRKLGFSFPESQTNFLFITHKEVQAKDLFEYLREKSIFVRYFQKPKIDNYLRVTIGTKEQMDIFLQVVENYLTNEGTNSNIYL
ncbi:MAG: histidinol-phosphate transaminase [Acetivibrio sp.]